MIVSSNLQMCEESEEISGNHKHSLYHKQTCPCSTTRALTHTHKHTPFWISVISLWFPVPPSEWTMSLQLQLCLKLQLWEAPTSRGNFCAALEASWGNGGSEVTPSLRFNVDAQKQKQQDKQEISYTKSSWFVLMGHQTSSPYSPSPYHVTFTGRWQTQHNGDVSN